MVMSHCGFSQDFLLTFLIASSQSASVLLSLRFDRSFHDPARWLAQSAEFKFHPSELVQDGPLPVITGVTTPMNGLKNYKWVAVITPIIGIKTQLITVFLAPCTIRSIVPDGCRHKIPYIHIANVFSTLTSLTLRLDPRAPSGGGPVFFFCQVCSHAKICASAAIATSLQGTLVSC